MSPAYMHKRRSIRCFTLRVADMCRTMRSPALQNRSSSLGHNHYADHTVHKERMQLKRCQPKVMVRLVLRSVILSLAISRARFTFTFRISVSGLSNSVLNSGAAMPRFEAITVVE
jgi:hypothetical protein